MKDIAREISEGTTRLKRIAGDLKTFARSNGGEATEIDLAVEIRRAWAMAVLPAIVRPELVMETASMPELTVQAHQLGQVLLNLFVNAVQAINGPGTVWVRCTTVDSSLVLEIRDSGPGIPAQHLKRVFDPFFTTKPPGQGTGLGLSVSFGILQGLGGKLDVESPPGQGAKFTLTLPRQPPGDQYNALRAGGAA
jgi:signal transduction histidine kinase